MGEEAEVRGTREESAPTRGRGIAVVMARVDRLPQEQGRGGAQLLFEGGYLLRNLGWGVGVWVGDMPVLTHSIHATHFQAGQSRTCVSHREGVDVPGYECIQG